MPDAPNYKACWAESLGGCSGGMSGEHTVSKGLFSGDSLTVQGLPWCLLEPRTLKKTALTRNILCSRHNSLLSEVDNAAIKVSRTFGDVAEMVTLRQKIKSRHWAVRRANLDGHLFERWLVKTLINTCFQRPNRIGPDGAEPGIPSKELVEIAFGLRRFTGHCGMKCMAASGQNIVYEERVQVRTLLHEDAVVAGVFDLHGSRFYLNLLPQEFTFHENSHLLGHDARFVFQVRNDKGKNVISHVVKFDFPGDARNKPLRPVRVDPR